MKLLLYSALAMAGRMMADDEFEDTFADELEMMRDVEQEEIEGEKISPTSK